MKKKVWIPLFASGILAILLAWPFFAMERKHSQKFLHDLSLLGHACLELGEFEPNVSQLSDENLFLALKGKNSRGLVLVPDKKFSYKIHNKRFRGPDNECIDLSIKADRVVIYVYNDPDPLTQIKDVRCTILYINKTEPRANQ